MSNLSAAPDGLRDRAKQVQKLRAEEQEIMKRLRILILGLSDSWKGESYEAFRSRFLEQSSAIADVNRLFGEFADLLNRVADDAENMDLNLLSQIHRKL